MKSITLIVLLAAGFLIMPASAQKTYDTGADDYGNMSAFDMNGNVYTVGSSNYSGSNGYDAFLMKTDPNGVFQWHKQYGGSGTEFGTAVVSVSTGLVIAGRSGSFGSGNNNDILLVKTDFNGDIQWAKTYGTDSTEEFAIKIAATADNGFAVTGQTNAIGSGGTEMFLLKTDSAGNVQWFKTYGSNSDEIGYHVYQENDNGFVLMGVSRGFGGAGMNDMYIVKTDTVGNIEAQLLIGTSGDDILKRGFNQNNHLILAGTMRPSGSNDDIFVGSLNLMNFTFDWFNTYGGSGNDGASGFVAVPDGGYAVCGTTGSFGATTDGIIIQLDSAGNVVYPFLSQGSGEDFIQDLIVGNGGYVTAYSNSYGGNANDVLLMVLGSSLPCTLQPVSITTTPVSPVINASLTLHTATSGNLTGNPVTLTQTSATSAENNLCGAVLTAEAGNDQATCVGGHVQIGGNPSATGGIPPYSYSWTPAGTLGNDTISNPIASPTGNITYYLTVTDSTGATATDSVTVSIGSFATISPPFPNICAGQNVTLTASGGTSYLWNTGDTTAMIVDFPGLGATSYSVVVMVGSCVDTASTIVTSHPYPTMAVSPSDTTICDTASIVLMASGAETYSWSPSTSLSSDTGATTLASPTSSITYTVTGKNAHCAGTPVTVTVNVTVCVGVAEWHGAPATIFPNPAQDVVNVSFNAPSSTEGILSIIAADGKMVKERHITIAPGENNFAIETEKLASGIYHIRITSGIIVSNGSFVIE